MEKRTVKKFVYTAAASSVVGHKPERDPSHIYRDNLKWADETESVDSMRVNERAKLIAERHLWALVSES